MAATGFSKKMGNCYPSTQHYLPEDNILNGGLWLDIRLQTYFF